MSTELQQFRNLWAARTEVSALSKAALGQALIDSLKGVKSDARADHEAQEAERIKREQAAYDVAEAYVNANIATLDPFLGEMNIEQLVTLIDAFRKVGDEDAATRITMYELVKNERQRIGGALQVAVRSTWVGKVGV